MKRTDFLSEKTYVLLPTRPNPKVYLPIADGDEIRRAFELYNPFSKKAKILRGIARFLCFYLPALAKSVLPTVRGGDSRFILFLEKQMEKKILTSLYIATAKDKVVVQIQDSEGILGYLKYPISDIGRNRLLTEREALLLLAPITKVPRLVLTATFEGIPLIILENLKGSIGSTNAGERKTVLKSFKKEQNFKLSEHPRIRNLKAALDKVEAGQWTVLLERVVAASKLVYREVFEHGDFTPWNLISTDEGIVPFDFEYFVEEGLEHLDELKYHFQEQRLLNNKKGIPLISSIQSRTELEEFGLLFRIFLLKEISVKAESSESFTFESSLLRLMDTTKPIS